MNADSVAQPFRRRGGQASRLYGLWRRRPGPGGKPARRGFAADSHAEPTSRTRRVRRVLGSSAWCGWVLVGGMLLCGRCGAADLEPPIVREVLVPYEDLDLLLGEGTDHVWMKRAEFQALLDQAGESDPPDAPEPAVMTHADYQVRIEQERALIHGRLTLEQLRPGVRALPLDLSGVGLRSVHLADRPAPIGYLADRGPAVLLDDCGATTLTLDAVAPLQTTGARQTLQIRLPMPAATRFRVQAAGDVDLIGGAQVVRREYRADDDVTELELLPPRGEVYLVLTRNRKLQRDSRVVVARSVLVDQVSSAIERLLARMSLDVLHRPEDEFAFSVPEGFEVLGVEAPNLQSWGVEDAGQGPVLRVRLQEETSGRVGVQIEAVRHTPKLAEWRFPRLVPLDAVGQAAVLGVQADARLTGRSLVAEGCIPVDRTLVLEDPANDRLRPIATYYAPTGEYSVGGRFVERPADRDVISHLRIHVTSAGLTASGGFVVAPREEPLFELSFTAPRPWSVTAVTASDGRPLSMDEVGLDAETRRIRVPLPRGVTPGSDIAVFYEAAGMPTGWLDPWSQFDVAVPVFAVVGARRERGALVISSAADLELEAQALEGLTPLDARRKVDFDLEDQQAGLAFEYPAQPFRAGVRVIRPALRATAQTFSFYRFDRSMARIRHEIRLEVEQGGTDTVGFRVPMSTPAQIIVEGLGPVAVKETVAAAAGDDRAWTVRLAREHHGPVGLAASYEIPVQPGSDGRLQLPVIQVDNVAYQSGRLALEGDPAWSIRVESHPRRVDIGELVEAAYQPGRRLLGAYAYVGDPVPLVLSVERPRPADLPDALIQRAELFSAVSSRGVVQTSARVLLRCRAPFLALQLPPDAELWSAFWKDRPLLPQQRDQRILLGMPAEAAEGLAELRVVYETPIPEFTSTGRIRQTAPQWFAVDRGAASAHPVPAAEVRWTLAFPAEYEAVAHGGSVEPVGRAAPELAVLQVGGLLYRLAGGIDRRKGLIGWIGGWIHQTFVGMGSALGGRDDYVVGESTVRRSQLERPMAEPPAPQDMESFDDLQMVAPAQKAEQVRSADRPAVVKQADESAPAASSSAAPRVARWSYEQQGKRSLDIDVSNQGATVQYVGLATAPRLDVTLEQRRRRGAWAGAVGLGVIVGGIGRTLWRKRLLYVAGILIASTLLVGVPGAGGWAPYLNSAFYAGCLLLLLYPPIDLVRAVGRGLARRAVRFRLFGPAGLLVAALAPAVASAAEERRPVSIPDDVVVSPWDAEAEGIAPSDAVWVPASRYRELWTKAHPDPTAAVPSPPVPFAWGAGEFQARLGANDLLVLTGRWQLRIFGDEPVRIPLRLEGALVSRALLDGSPSLLQSLADGADQLPDRPAADASPTDVGRLDLLVRGAGLHDLELECRVKVRRQGGWRTAQAILPAGPATVLALTVPQAGSEVVVTGAPDQERWITERPGQSIETVLGPGGRIDLRWRPSVGPAVTDTDLTVETASVFDVGENALRWQGRFTVRFRGAERDRFTLEIPEHYLVEGVLGANLRGWDWDAETNWLHIYMLKPADAQAAFDVALRAAGVGVLAEPVSVHVPSVGLREASRQAGRIRIRRSPRLELQHQSQEGVRRVRLAAAGTEPAGSLRLSESPLGLVPLHQYEFAAVPYEVIYQAGPLREELSASLQTVLHVAERDRRLESRIRMDCGKTPRYRLLLMLPENLEIRSVRAPGAFEWDVSEQDGRRRLLIQFATGITGEVAIVVEGAWGGSTSRMESEIPILWVADADRQHGEIAIQTDPGFDVDATGSVHLESMVRDRAFRWLQPAQRERTRLALHYRDPEAAGRIQLRLRPSQVEARSVTNARVTDRAVEETTLIHFNIREAGIRRVEFVLPAASSSVRVRVPYLRSKQLSAAPEGDAVRIALELQEAVQNELKVLIEHDRVLTGGPHAVHAPTILTGRAVAQYLAVENAGRDEVMVEQTMGVSELSRSRDAYALVSELLAGGATQAYVVDARAADPRLTFVVRARAAVETAGASIGLSRATVMLDGHGAYRARQVFHLQNRTEQALTVELPAEATLWTAKVAGEVVKPLADASERASVVHLPLVQTDAGELDVRAELIYGGSLPDPGAYRRVRIPLIRSVNLGVELSQVQLYVPRTHHWLGFRGGLEPVRTLGDLEAGYLSYQNKLLKRLTHTLKFGSAFAKVRAGRNLDILQGLQAQLTQEAGARFAGNEKVGDQIVVARQLLKDAQRELRDADFQEMLLSDNRMNLMTAFQTQSNEIRDAGAEFKASNWPGDMALVPASMEADEARQESLRQWLEANELVEVIPETPLAELEARQEEVAGRPTEPLEMKAEAQLQRLGIALDDERPSRRDDARRVRRSRQDLAVQYRQGLRAPGSPVGGPGEARADPRAEPSGLQEVAGSEVDRLDRDLPSATPAGRPMEPAALMSLEVDLPLLDPARWERLAFESPRSAVDLSGHAISLRVIQGGQRLAIAAGAALIAWWTLRVLRGRRPDPSRQLLLYNVLIMVGLVGLLLGVFPIGSVAVVVGAWVARHRVRHIMRTA